MKYVGKYEIYIGVVAVVSCLLGCSNEQSARDAWEAAKITAENDKLSAIREAETLIVEYPKSVAAQQARDQVPFWIHSLFYAELKRVSEEVATSASTDDLEFIHELSVRLSGPDLARPLVRIMEDYPEYELRELVELQIVCMAMWGPLARVGLSFRVWADGFNAKVERAMAIKGPYDDLLRARVDLIAETMRGMKDVVSEMSGGFEEAGTVLNSLSARHPQRQHLAEGSRLLVGFSDASAQLAEAIDYAVEFYEEEAFECSKTANTYTDGLLGQLGRSWKLQGCRKAEEKLARKLKPAGVELEHIIEEMDEWVEKSDLGEYISGLGGLDKLKAAVGES